ncbi:MAG TPA: Ig-like domain-containing protein, partial [Promineifilum sp.]|nr:Ig-like domain-containing protein [Promineifilum sp.]
MVTVLPVDAALLTIYPRQPLSVSVALPAETLSLPTPASETRTSETQASETQASLLINEIDAIAASEAAEFIELYDGGVGNTPLDGLTLVLYRGDRASVYLAIGLDGARTDSRGYYVLGGPAIDADQLLAAGLLRDGPDAVALFAASVWDFPVNSPVVVEGLLDAVVYAPRGTPATGLQPLLLPDELPVDEGQRGAAEAHSAQRFPNGQGQAREMAAFTAGPPTPDEPNKKSLDYAPTVTNVWPMPDASDVPNTLTISVTFSEPVMLHDTPITLACERSGVHPYALNGGPLTYGFRPYIALASGDACAVTVYGDRVSDMDEDDPPDGMLASYKWYFTAAQTVAQNIVLNEIDADTPSTDTAEFIELFDGGGGATPLDGLLLVLFNGGDDRSYRTIDLAGYTTDAAGYFVLGNAAIVGAEIELPDGALQNGTDAIALVAGRAEAFPNGTPVTGVTPLDAVVYGRSDEPDAGLLPLLNDGQPAIDENSRGEAESHSNQRCPNGAGGARNTAGFRQNTPTPRAASDCQTDVAPGVSERSPAPGATGVSVSVTLRIDFTEPVSVGKSWLTLACSTSGAHSSTTTGGPSAFFIQPNEPLAYAETCTVTLKAALIHDLDTDDPPDTLTGNLTWKFTTAEAPAAFVIINETDADTPGSDTSEFIELYDGGRGATRLDGLVLVFYNGATNTAYTALDLDGQRTDSAGYWLAGNAAVTPGLAFANGTLQNGPDAVALYAGDATQFPADTPLHTRGLLDAVVYGEATNTPGLLALLLPGESAADEGARGAADAHALQRCPNGAGGQRRTAALRPAPPTPGKTNICALDAAPVVTAVVPSNGETGVAIDVALTVTFSEPVAPVAGWLRLRCGNNDYAINVTAADPARYTATPTTLLPRAATCYATIAAALVHDADNDDPPDILAADYTWSFATAAPVADFVLINELDSDTPGSDTAEFVELYDGGVGGTDLSGLVLVFFNGTDDHAYFAVDLDGVQTEGDGYAVAGSAALGGALTLPAAMIQNGPDAVALYEGDAADFPNGTGITTDGLRDAIVYGTSDPTDNGLLALLAAGQAQVDENARAAAEADSSGRCPNGAGGRRYTATYRQNAPTPGRANDCHADAPPAVAAVSPTDGADHVAAAAQLQVEFSEKVTLDGNWFGIVCDASGSHTATTGGGPTTFT